MTEPGESDRWQSILDDLGVPAESQASPSQLQQQMTGLTSDISAVPVRAEASAEPPPALAEPPETTDSAAIEAPLEPSPPARGRRRSPRKSAAAREANDNESIDKDCADGPAEESRGRRRRRPARGKAPEGETAETSEAVPAENPELVETEKEIASEAAALETEAILEFESDQEAPAGESELAETGSEDEVGEEGPDEPGESSGRNQEGRRRRRRRRKKSTAPAPESAPVVETFHPEVDEDADELEVDEEFAVEEDSEEVEKDPVHEEEDDEEFDDLSNLNVPLWNDIVAGLYRPER
jgi:hypothetical protein